MPSIPKLAIEISDWVMNGRCTVADLEFYEEFNQGYSPAAWMGHDKADAELLTFVQDGVGGQYALWVVHGVDGAPVVKLGRDGEVAVLGRDLVDFAWLIACGVEPIGVGDNGELDNPPTNASAEMQAWVRSIAPERTFGSAQETLAAAAAAHPTLVAHVSDLASS